VLRPKDSKSTWTAIGEPLLVRAGKPEEHVSGFPFNFERKAAAWVSASLHLRKGPLGEGRATLKG
jgi:hypothetical protein